jgi:hypothetical protein
MNRQPDFVPVDVYVLDVLLRDLVGHDKRPAAFLVYLYLYAAAARSCWRPVKASLRDIAEATRFVEERRGNRNENSSTPPSPDYANQLPNRPPSAPGSSSLAFFLVPRASLQRFTPDAPTLRFALTPARGTPKGFHISAHGGDL